jgi:hypothetical protein
MLAAAVAPLLLTGCLWGPGKFTSDLALRTNGTFTLDYRGEILLKMPPDMDRGASAFDADNAVCHRDGEPQLLEPGERDGVNPDEDNVRPCTPAEIAKLKTQYEREAAEKAAKKRKENEDMAKVFGLPGSDDESNRRFAANLMKYQGWRSVRYAGKGVFDVDYHFEGRVGQDYAFPMMPESDFIVPFIMIRRRNDGSVMITAPALTGGAGPLSARASAMGIPEGKDGPQSRAEGRFTITTDGEILTNNSEDGPVVSPSGKSVRWDVGPASKKVPEMLVRL